MGMTEKEALINTITLSLAEDYSINIKSVKAKLNEIMQGYHITITNEDAAVNPQDTEFLFSKFAEGKKAIGMNDKTIRQYHIAIEVLEKYINKRFADAEVDEINNFLIAYGKTVSSVTLKAKYQLLSSIYNYLFLHKYISYNPIAYIDVPKAEVIYKQPINDCDIEKLKTACEKLDSKESLRDTAILYFFISTGCRVSELCNVKIEDVNLEKKICTVKGKGKKQRPVVLSDKCIYRLKLYLETRKDTTPTAPLFCHIRGEEKPITKDGIRMMLNRLKKQVGIEKLTCHSFRRFYASELRRRNVNVQMIASSLGHANLNQVNRYSLYDSNEMLSIIRDAM